MSTPRKRSYKMGNRSKNDFGKVIGQVSESRWAWVKLYFGTFIIWGDYHDDDEGNRTEHLRDIKLMFQDGGRGSNSWNLTACTEEELVSLKHLLDTAIEYALPIARERDRQAQDAFDNGDDSHIRIYRQVPQLVYRKGPVGEHGEGVHDGPSDAAPVSRDGDDQPGGLRGEGPEVAERDSGDGGTQDDGSQAD